MAGLDGRTEFLGFSKSMAAVFEKEGEPGTAVVGIMHKVAGLDGRSFKMGFTR
jgi:hypothetical protein